MSKQMKRSKSRATSQPVTLTRSQILAREWKDDSTEEIQRRIASIQKDVDEATSDLARHDFAAKGLKVKVATGTADMAALQRLVQARSDC